MELSMAETVIMAMALRNFLENDMSPKDRELAESVSYKLRLSFKRKKYKIAIFGED